MGTKDCGHSYVLRGTYTSSFVFRGIEINISFLGLTDAVIGIAYGFSIVINFLFCCLRKGA